MGSDGLWDFINTDEISDIIDKFKVKEKIAEELWKLCIQKAAFDSGLKFDDIIKKDPGTEKRKIHDDITILVVDLKQQFSQ